MMNEKILVTGGAGFIGSQLVKYLCLKKGLAVLNVDSLSYAGNLDNLKSVSAVGNYQFVKADISDVPKMKEIIQTFKPDIVMHLAAESHVDRSIDSARSFIDTNITGTFSLLEVCRAALSSGVLTKDFVFHHVSTDEVFGDLAVDDPPFSEETPYAPSSPYSASKAASDHLVRAWGRTYDFPFVITNCSNNYGHHQFPEKLIPHMIISAIQGKELPIYGDGLQIRDWLYVDDHVEALTMVATSGRTGETYNIGGNTEQSNISIVKMICDILDEAVSNKSSGLDSFHDLISFVKDRPGHDRRYAINSEKIQTELGWLPKTSLEKGLLKTVRWYLNNEEWWKNILNGNYVLQRSDEKNK